MDLVRLFRQISFRWSGEREPNFTVTFLGYVGAGFFCFDQSACWNKVFPIILLILSLFTVLLEGISWSIRLPYLVPQNPGACSRFRRYIYSWSLFNEQEIISTRVWKRECFALACGYRRFMVWKRECFALAYGYWRFMVWKRECFALAYGYWRFMVWKRECFALAYEYWRCMVWKRECFALAYGYWRCMVTSLLCDLFVNLTFMNPCIVIQQWK